MYLRISNPGLADMNALMVLGVSTSRYHSGSIGQFGTGSKFAIALLLRSGIPLEVYIGHLKMSFFTNPLSLEDGSVHQQVHVRLSGKLNEKSVNRKEKLSYTTGLGEVDWTDVSMGLREFVSNAIDSCVKQGRLYSDVSVDLVDKPRAKAGYTSVFIPLTVEVNRFYQTLHEKFLHFRKDIDMECRLLPKICPDKDETRIYKNGVLVYVADMPSSYDYNVNSLQLDESRNARWWDVRASCADVLKKVTDQDKLSKVVKDVCDGSEKEWFEKELDGYCLSSRHDPDKDERGEAWQGAIERVFGENSCVLTVPMLKETIRHKGYTPVILPSNFVEMVEHLPQVRKESDVLNGLERQGRVEMPVSQNMLSTVDHLWEIIELHGMSNGKEKPPVKAFKENMEAGSQVNGEYFDGVVWLRWDMDGSQAIRKTALEELAHHCSGATDMSRDFQEWILRLAAYVLYSEYPLGGENND